MQTILGNLIIGAALGTRLQGRISERATGRFFSVLLLVSASEPRRPDKRVRRASPA